MVAIQVDDGFIQAQRKRGDGTSEDDEHKDEVGSPLLGEFPAELVPADTGVADVGDGYSEPHTHQVAAFAEDFVKYPESHPPLGVAVRLARDHRHSGGGDTEMVNSLLMGVLVVIFIISILL